MEADAKVLLLTYVDDNIEEAEVELNSISGIDIPVLLLKRSQALRIFQELDTTNKSSGISIELEYRRDQLFPDDAGKILVFLSSQPLKNPAIKFLGDLRRHESLMKGKELEIVFSVGFCTSCREEGYLAKASRCLSAGRYCAINSIFKTDELVKETLRQICIRNYFGNHKLIMYLENLERLSLEYYAKDLENLEFDESRLNHISERALAETRIPIADVSECFSDSFIHHTPLLSASISTKRRDIDIYFDDNSLLQKEQERFLMITPYNIFPLIILDDILYNSRINLRTFVDFGCKRSLLNCAGFSKYREIFFNSLVVTSVMLILLLAWVCKKALERRGNRDMHNQFQQVMKKYYRLHEGTSSNAFSLDKRGEHSKDLWLFIREKSSNYQMPHISIWVKRIFNSFCFRILRIFLITKYAFGVELEI